MTNNMMWARIKSQALDLIVLNTVLNTILNVIVVPFLFKFDHHSLCEYFQTKTNNTHQYRCKTFIFAALQQQER